MAKLMTEVVAFLRDRKGLTAVEYAIIAGVLTVVVLAAFTTFGSKITTRMGGITF